MIIIMVMQHLSFHAELVERKLPRLPIASQTIFTTCSSTDTRVQARASKSTGMCLLREVDSHTNNTHAQDLARKQKASLSHPGPVTAPRCVLSRQTRPWLGETVEHAKPLTLHSRTLLHGRLRSNKGAITRCWRSGGNGAEALSSQAVGEGKQALVRHRPCCEVSFCRGRGADDLRGKCSFSVRE